MENVEKRYDLTGTGIDDAGEAAYDFLTADKVERKDALRVRLALEEALLRYRDEGTAEGFTLRCRRRFRAPRVELTVTGPSLDPLAEQDGPDSGALTGMMAQMGLAPLWQYKDGTNRVLFTPKRKKRSLMVSLALALVLAVALGYLCRLMPETARLTLSDKLVSPLFNTFVGLLTAVSGPMIFLSVTWGICCIGDMVSFGRIGKRMIGKFILFTVLLSVIAGAAVLPFFPMAAGGGQAFDPSELMDMVLDIVPANFFTPFTEGNPLQIIFVAVLIGIALLLLGEKVSVAATFVEQSNYVVQLIMEAVSSLVPVFVFGSVFKMFLGDGFRLLAQSYKLIPVIILGTAVMMACSLALVCVRWKVGPMTVLKKYWHLLDFPNEAYARAVIQLCRGHRKTDLFNEAEYPSAFEVEPGKSVSLPYLAALICLADELDISADRNISFLYDVEHMPSARDRQEFHKHMAIRRVELTPERVIVHAWTEDPEVRGGVEDVTAKLRDKLLMCRRVAAERSAFVITQADVVLRMEKPEEPGL